MKGFQPKSVRPLLSCNALLAPAAAAAASIGLLPARVWALPTLSATSLGTPSDNAGHTASGYTAYRLTLTADPGEVITAFDAGYNAGSTNGIYGPMLQDWPAPPNQTLPSVKLSRRIMLSRSANNNQGTPSGV